MFGNEVSAFALNGTVLIDGGDHGNGKIWLRTGTGTISVRMAILNNGNVGIGTTTPGGQFELSLDQGRKPGGGTWTTTSDERLKNIEGIYAKGLQEILQLQPITYRYKNVGDRQFADPVLRTLNVGFSAQDVQRIFPEAVGVDNDGYLNFNMHSILVAYVNAFKEKQMEIEQVRSKNEELEIENKDIRSKYLLLRSDMDTVKGILELETEK